MKLDLDKILDNGMHYLYKLLFFYKHEIFLKYFNIFKLKTKFLNYEYFQKLY